MSQTKNKRLESLQAEKRRKTILSVVLAVICVIYVLPVLSVVINSFKLNTYVKTDTFALPFGEMWAGFANFEKGMTFGNYPFINSVLSLVIAFASFAPDALRAFVTAAPAAFTASSAALSSSLNFASLSSRPSRASSFAFFDARSEMRSAIAPPAIVYRGQKLC